LHSSRQVRETIVGGEDPGKSGSHISGKDVVQNCRPDQKYMKRNGKKKTKNGGAPVKKRGGIIKRKTQGGVKAHFLVQ